jgi:cytochrome c oxidase subunit IV
MRHLIVGTILIALGILGMSMWWESFGLVMRALVPLTLLVFGVLAVLSSYFRMGSPDAASESVEEDLAED